METFKIGICEPDHFSEKAISQLKKIGSVEFFNTGTLRDFILDKNAIFIRLKYKIDDALILHSSNLKYICSPTTGLNHINISDPSIEIISLKGEYEFLDSIRATPEHVFGITLSLLRNYAHAFMRQGDYAFNRDLYRGYELYGNTVGIIGLGRVGKIISKYFKAFGSKVYFYDIEKKSSSFSERCSSLENLISKSKIVILSANYTEANEQMIDKRHFEKMKGKYFINAARGELVNESDLLQYAQKEWFMGVAIDVFSNETKESNFFRSMLSLTKKKNIILTPHIGGATYSSMSRTEEFIAIKLQRAIQNK